MFYIKVLVYADSKKEKIILKKKDFFEIYVKEKAQRNMANNRILELLSLYFKVSKNKIRIINGHHHPSKLLVIEEK